MKKVQCVFAGWEIAQMAQGGSWLGPGRQRDRAQLGDVAVADLQPPPAAPPGGRAESCDHAGMSPLLTERGHNTGWEECSSCPGLSPGKSLAPPSPCAGRIPSRAVCQPSDQSRSLLDLSSVITALAAASAASCLVCSPRPPSSRIIIPGRLAAAPQRSCRGPAAFLQI